MNRAVENALYLIGGLLTGGAISYIVTTKVFGEKIREVVSEEVADMTRKQMAFESAQKDEIISSQNEELEELRQKVSNPMPKNPPTQSKSSITDPSFVKPEVKNEAEVNKYYKPGSIIAEHYDVSAAQKVIEDDLETVEAIKHIPQDYPYMISSLTFNDPLDDEYRMDYTHVVLRYFEKDDILCVDGTTGCQMSGEDLEDYPEWKKIDRYESVVGRAWKKNINLDPDGGTLRTIDGTFVDWAVDEAFVANDYMKTQFQINYDKGSYQEWVIDQGRL